MPVKKYILTLKSDLADLEKLRSFEQKIDSRGRHPRFDITVRFYGGTNDMLQGPTYGRLTVD
jgi:hypothetical protein